MTVPSQTIHVLPGTRRPRVALVIPAYNEERSLPRLLAEIESFAAHQPRIEWMPIIVNDGSADRTEIVALALARRYNVRLISLPINLGIGKTVQAGFRFAVALGADVVVQLDGDGQHPAPELPKLTAPILSGHADVTVGSRYARGAGGNVSTPLRQAGTWFFGKLLKLLTGQEISDATSGFRAFGAEAADFIARHYPDDYPEVQAYVPLARRGFRIHEVGVTMRPRERGASSITAVRSVYYMIKVGFATAIEKIRPLPERRRPVATLTRDVISLGEGSRHVG